MFCASLMSEFLPGPVPLRAATPWRALTRMACVVGVLAIAACATPPPPPPPVISEIQLTVVAGPDVNPDARKRASPVLVRIYALKSAAPFEAADFFSLFEKDTARVARKSRYTMHKAINADYYGFRDEDDGILLKVEARAEVQLQRKVCS